MRARKKMTKQQQKRLSRIYDSLNGCKEIISNTVKETYQAKNIKKHQYIPFRDRLNTLKSETQLKKLRFYL